MASAGTDGTMLNELSKLEASIKGGLIQLVEEKPAGPVSLMTVPLIEATATSCKDIAPLSLLRNSRTQVVRMIPGSGGVHVRADGSIHFKLSADSSSTGTITSVTDIMNDYDQGLWSFLTDGSRKGQAATGLSLHGADVVVTAMSGVTPIERVYVAIGGGEPEAMMIDNFLTMMGGQLAWTSIHEETQGPIFKEVQGATPLAQRPSHNAAWLSILIRRNHHHCHC